MHDQLSSEDHDQCHECRLSVPKDTLARHYLAPGSGAAGLRTTDPAAVQLLIL